MSSEIPYRDIAAPNSSTSSDFFPHLRVLLWKQYLTQVRSKKNIICVCISPVLLCLILFLIQITVTAGLQFEDPNPVVLSAGSFQACTPMRGLSSCYSIGYGIFGNDTAPWVEYTLDYIANKTGLKRGIDIVQIYNGTNYTDFNNAFIQTPGQVQIGLMFCTAAQLTDVPPALSALPDNCQQILDLDTFISYEVTPYLIVYNRSLISTDFQANPELPYPTYPTALQLKILVDNGIMDFYNEQNGQERISVLTQSYPQTQLRFFQGFDIADQQGAIYFFIAPIITFIVILNEITLEKEKKLRQGLSVVGVSHFTYWVHWVVLAVIYALMVTISLIASGYIFQFKVFTNCPIMIHFLLFFFFTMAMESFGLFIYTLVPTVKMANTAGYTILLLGIVIQLFISNNLILQYLYDTTNSVVYKIIIDILLIYPAFNFSAVYTDIAMLAGDTFSQTEARWVPGPGYSWADFTASHSGTLPSGDPYDYPSSLNFMLWLIINSLIFFVLSYYADHVVAHNRGSASSPLFFLSRNYWRFLRKPQKAKIINVDSPLSEDESMLDNNVDTVLREREKVIRHVNDGVPAKGIRIESLSKVYKQNSCGCKSRNDVKALNDVCLEVSEGELLGLLGHNGAGKTTLINILTGVLGGFEGRVTINTYDIAENKDEVKKIVGVCPQFDILWYELTALEHLKMFAQIKRIPKELIEKQAREALVEVNLAKVADVWAGTFSGGMKRRLSMAIASMGNPKIIFLDEPTTGMDPKNRRQVWELIKNLKKDKVVILTTHAMEEADALSDRIAVIVDGRLKCIGTSLFLKNNFGEGYRLTLVVDPDDAATAKNLMKLKIPSATVMDESGGSIMFSLPASEIKQLQAFFRIIEDKDHDDAARRLKEITHDWGLSNTTLEEVFMKVTGKKEKKLE